MTVVDSDRVLGKYLTAREHVIAEGYGEEIDSALAAAVRSIGEPNFLSNLAWVVFASGFSESVLRRLFPRLRAAFLDFTSAQVITESYAACRTQALSVFANERKVEAVLWAAGLIAREGFERTLQEVEIDPIESLQQFPMIGPVTSYHLAKNLGYPVAKADRHVQRLSDMLGFREARQLCQYLSEWSGDPISVVDVVLWRYATIVPDYLARFRYE